MIFEPGLGSGISILDLGTWNEEPRLLIIEPRTWMLELETCNFKQRFGNLELEPTHLILETGA